MEAVQLENCAYFLTKLHVEVIGMQNEQLISRISVSGNLQNGLIFWLNASITALKVRLNLVIALQSWPVSLKSNWPVILKIT